MIHVPPVNQATIGIYRGNAAALAARIDSFTSSRGNLQKWRLPSYARFSNFAAYEMQMEIIFNDSFTYDVVMGRALRTAPVIGEPATDTSKRSIYDECNYQAYALIVRTFTPENGVFLIPVVARKIMVTNFGIFCINSITRLMRTIFPTSRFLSTIRLCFGRRKILPLNTGPLKFVVRPIFSFQLVILFPNLKKQWFFAKALFEKIYRQV